MTRKLIYILTILPALLISIPSTALTIRKVGPSETYTSIGAAVSAASAGDIIELQGDITESGPISISKNLTLRSAGGQAYTVNAQGSSDFISIAWSTSGIKLTIQNIKFDGGADCTIPTFLKTTNSRDEVTLFFVEVTRFNQVLNLAAGTCTIQYGSYTYNNNSSTSADDEASGAASIFNVGGFYNTKLVVESGDFIGNNTAVGPIFHLPSGSSTIHPEFQLKGGYFADNNLSNHGEVIRVGYGDTPPGIYGIWNSTLGCYLKPRYNCTVKVSGDPIFEDGQYIHLRRYVLQAMNGSGTLRRVYDVVPQLIKDGPLSQYARINVSTNLGGQLRGTNGLSFLTSGNASVSSVDLSVFNQTYTDLYATSDPLSVKTRFGYDIYGDPALQFTYFTTIVITRYGLQSNDSAVYNIYKETSPGAWTRVHGISLTGKGGVSKVSRTVNIPYPGKFKVEETDFNWKYEKTVTSIDGLNASVTAQGAGIAESSGTSNVITFEVRGNKKPYTIGVGSENMKQNIFTFIQGIN